MNPKIKRLVPNTEMPIDLRPNARFGSKEEEMGRWETTTNARGRGAQKVREAKVKESRFISLVLKQKKWAQEMNKRRRAK